MEPYTIDELFDYMREYYPELETAEQMVQAEEVITNTVSFRLWLVSLRMTQFLDELKEEYPWVKELVEKK